jgi:hypothetical protein
MDCEENEKCKLHTIIISYKGNGTEPKYTYSSGDEQPLISRNQSIFSMRYDGLLYGRIFWPDRIYEVKIASAMLDHALLVFCI